MYPFFAVKAPLLLYPFRFLNPVTGKWTRARYVAERHEIESRYDRWEIIGPPEIRRRSSEWNTFNPFRQPAGALAARRRATAGSERAAAD